MQFSDGVSGIDMPSNNNDAALNLGRGTGKTRYGEKTKVTSDRNTQTFPSNAFKTLLKIDSKGCL